MLTAPPEALPTKTLAEPQPAADPHIALVVQVILAFTLEALCWLTGERPSDFT